MQKRATFTRIRKSSTTLNKTNEIEKFDRKALGRIVRNQMAVSENKMQMQNIINFEHNTKKLKFNEEVLDKIKVKVRRMSGLPARP